MAPPSVDFIYWTFSAAAKSIAAFIAFILTGFALVHSLMESARERDDSLEEVHAALRASYYRNLSRLAWLTGAAIVFSLLVVFANRPNAPVPTWALILVAVVDLGAILAGIYFVVSIVDPNRYERAAKRVIEEEPQRVTGGSPSGEFFDAFIHLERIVREYLRERDLYIPSRGAPRMSFSFRQMIEALRTNEKIDRDTYDELMALNKYRNLVFHGHVQRVDPDMVSRTRAVAKRMAELQ